jgi:hypothetical protein
MDDAAAVHKQLVRGLTTKDLDAAVSCWHPDVDVVHLLRPDRSWHGADTYRRVQAHIWDSCPTCREEVVSSGVVGNLIYLETLTYHADGSAIPCVSILEVEGGQIRRGRIYTDRPAPDGLSMDGWVHDMNP